MHTTCSMKCHKELKSTKIQNNLPGTLPFSQSGMFFSLTSFKDSREKERVVRKGMKFKFCN